MMTRARQACAAGRSTGAAVCALAALLAVAWWGAGPSARAPGPLPRVIDGFVPALEASMREQPPATEHAPASAAEGHEAEEGERSSALWMTIGKIVNSFILVGTLFYFLRPGIKQYLDDRTMQVRQELVSASETRAAAGAELEKLDRRLAGLPAEIDALRARGAQEVAAEQVRIREATDALRERLVNQTRREIDLRAKAAEHDLLEHAADSTVRLATERIRRSVTDRDQLRLIDRYVEQMRTGS